MSSISPSVSLFGPLSDTDFSYAPGKKSSFYRHFKDLEAKIHESLYTNIVLLSKFYPLSSDFEKVIKRDMFQKNNKAAFHQTVFYLLNILNPESFKQKITSWPIFDIKMETQFRHEILIYLNELNTIYEDANIPPIMASQLISPGGFKFARFMLMLSQLVLLEHLKKQMGDELLHPIKSNKNAAITESIIKRLKTRTLQIETKVNDKARDFYEYHAKCQDEANEMMQQILKLKKDLEKCRKGPVDDPKGLDLENWTKESSKKLTRINKDMENYQELVVLINSVKDKLSTLPDNKLQYKGDLRIPHCIQHIIKNTEKMDLLEILSGVKSLLERKNIELPNPSDSYLDKMKKLFTLLNENYEEILKSCEELKSALVSLDIK